VANRPILRAVSAALKLLHFCSREHEKAGGFEFINGILELFDQPNLFKWSQVVRDVSPRGELP
jgi:hypothetical protein